MLVRMSRLRFLVGLLWLIVGSGSVIWVFAAANLRSPYLLAVREEVFWLWVLAGLMGAVFLIFQGKHLLSRFHPLHLVACATLLGLGLAGNEQWRHDQDRRWVEKTPAARMPGIGRHLMIGWLGFEETRSLAAKGAIAGVFLTRRDFPKNTRIVEIRRTVDALQSARREAGLPPLWIATDQEGGPVSKLSPPLPAQPALGTLLRDLDGPDLTSQPARAAEIVRRVTTYAETQGRTLADAGINLNFAPVVDLRPAAPPDSWDRNSRIYNRALATDPAVVTLAGETYVTVLARHGVTAVLKHFPGLGNVPADTHHFSARLDSPVADLIDKDWLPFRQISQRTKAGIMLSHVRLVALDPGHPSSGSSATVELLRKQWHVTGLLVTDDFSMAPISHGPGGIVRAARNSMASGVDLILLSYDPETVYDLLGAAGQEHE